VYSKADLVLCHGSWSALFPEVSPLIVVSYWETQRCAPPARSPAAAPSNQMLHLLWRHVERKLWQAVSTKGKMCFSLLPYYMIAAKKMFVLNFDGATFCAKINHKSGLFRLKIMHEVGPLPHTHR